MKKLAVNRIICTVLHLIISHAAFMRLHTQGEGDTRAADAAPHTRHNYINNGM